MIKISLRKSIIHGFLYYNLINYINFTKREYIAHYQIYISHAVTKKVNRKLKF